MTCIEGFPHRSGIRSPSITFHFSRVISFCSLSIEICRFGMTVMFDLSTEQSMKCGSLSCNMESTLDLLHHPYSESSSYHTMLELKLKLTLEITKIKFSCNVPCTVFNNNSEKILYLLRAVLIVYCSGKPRYQVVFIPSREVLLLLQSDINDLKKKGQYPWCNALNFKRAIFRANMGI